MNLLTACSPGLPRRILFLYLYSLPERLLLPRRVFNVSDYKTVCICEKLANKGINVSRAQHRTYMWMLLFFSIYVLGSVHIRKSPRCIHSFFPSYLSLYSLISWFSWGLHRRSLHISVSTCRIKTKLRSAKTKKKYTKYHESGLIQSATVDSDKSWVLMRGRTGAGLEWDQEGIIWIFRHFLTSHLFTWKICILKNALIVASIPENFLRDYMEIEVWEMPACIHK